MFLENLNKSIPEIRFSFLRLKHKFPESVCALLLSHRYCIYLFSFPLTFLLNLSIYTHIFHYFFGNSRLKFLWNKLKFFSIFHVNLSRFLHLYNCFIFQYMYNISIWPRKIFFYERDFSTGLLPPLTLPLFFFANIWSFSGKPFQN